MRPRRATMRVVSGPALSLLALGAPVLGAGPFADEPEPAAPETGVVTRLTDAAIIESSGLVDLGRVLVTTNDSGSGPQLYAVSVRTGRTAAVTDFGADVVDVEALAPAGGRAVWVGDIGDNLRRRDDVRVYRVPVAVRAGADERATVQVRAQSWTLRYADGAHDAEALLASPRSGRLFVVTKAPLGGAVYAVPPLRAGSTSATGDVLTMRRVASVPQWVTDGAFAPDGRSVLLRGYVDAAQYRVPGWRQVRSRSLPGQDQGEGLSVGSGGRVLLSSEGEDQPVLGIRWPGLGAGSASHEQRPDSATSDVSLPRGQSDGRHGSGSGAVVAEPGSEAGTGAQPDVARYLWGATAALVGLLAMVALGVSRRRRG